MIGRLEDLEMKNEDLRDSIASKNDYDSGNY